MFYKAEITQDCQEVHVKIQFVSWNPYYTTLNKRKRSFGLSQDISKAFDSINLDMLTLSMKRLKIPDLCQRLIISLFTDRLNQVITSHGLTDSYKVRIGIDQGETISPLLWVIYYDPP